MINETYILTCDFSNPDHLKALGMLINEYILDDMGGGKPLNPLQQLRLVDGLNNHPTAIVLLAITNEAPSGIIVAFKNFSTFTVKPMINVHDIFVATEYRQSGVGKKLMDALVAEAEMIGCSRITLEVREDNVPAQYLYRRFGFDETTPPMLYWRKNL